MSGENNAAASSPDATMNAALSMASLMLLGDSQRAAFASADSNNVDAYRSRTAGGNNSTSAGSASGDVLFHGSNNAAGRSTAGSGNSNYDNNAQHQQYFHFPGVNFNINTINESRRIEENHRPQQQLEGGRLFYNDHVGNEGYPPHHQAAANYYNHLSIGGSTGYGNQHQHSDMFNHSGGHHPYYQHFQSPPGVIGEDAAAVANSWPVSSQLSNYWLGLEEQQKRQQHEENGRNNVHSANGSSDCNPNARASAAASSLPMMNLANLCEASLATKGSRNDLDAATASVMASSSLFSSPPTAALPMTIGHPSLATSEPSKQAKYYYSPPRLDDVLQQRPREQQEEDERQQHEQQQYQLGSLFGIGGEDNNSRLENLEFNSSNWINNLHSYHHPFYYNRTSMNDDLIYYQRPTNDKDNINNGFPSLGYLPVALPHHSQQHHLNHNINSDDYLFQLEQLQQQQIRLLQEQQLEESGNDKSYNNSYLSRQNGEAAAPDQSNRNNSSRRTTKKTKGAKESNNTSKKKKDVKSKPTTAESATETTATDSALATVTAATSDTQQQNQQQNEKTLHTQPRNADNAKTLAASLLAAAAAAPSAVSPGSACADPSSRTPVINNSTRARTMPFNCSTDSTDVAAMKDYLNWLQGQRQEAPQREQQSEAQDVDINNLPHAAALVAAMRDADESDDNASTRSTFTSSVKKSDSKKRGDSKPKNKKDASNRKIRSAELVTNLVDARDQNTHTKFSVVGERRNPYVEGTGPEIRGERQYDNSENELKGNARKQTSVEVDVNTSKNTSRRRSKSFKTDELSTSRKQTSMKETNETNSKQDVEVAEEKNHDNDTKKTLCQEVTPAEERKEGKLKKVNTTSVKKKKKTKEMNVDTEEQLQLALELSLEQYREEQRQQRRKRRGLREQEKAQLQERQQQEEPSPAVQQRDLREQEKTQQQERQQEEEQSQAMQWREQEQKDDNTEQSEPEVQEKMQDQLDSLTVSSIVKPKSVMIDPKRGGNDNSKNDKGECIVNKKDCDNKDLQRSRKTAVSEVATDAVSAGDRCRVDASTPGISYIGQEYDKSKNVAVRSSSKRSSLPPLPDSLDNNNNDKEKKTLLQRKMVLMQQRKHSSNSSILSTSTANTSASTGAKKDKNKTDSSSIAVVDVVAHSATSTPIATGKKGATILSSTDADSAGPPTHLDHNKSDECKRRNNEEDVQESRTTRASSNLAPKVLPVVTKKSNPTTQVTRSSLRLKVHGEEAHKDDSKSTGEETSNSDERENEIKVQDQNADEVISLKQSQGEKTDAPRRRLRPRKKSTERIADNVQEEMEEHSGESVCTSSSKCTEGAATKDDEEQQRPRTRSNAKRNASQLPSYLSTRRRSYASSVHSNTSSVHSTTSSVRSYDEGEETISVVQDINIKKIASRGEQEKPAQFAIKVFRMLKDEANHSIIEWKNGQILLHNPPLLEEQILGQYFCHNNFKSFHRQLNYFGFRMMARRKDATSSTPCIYIHDDFDASCDISAVLQIKKNVHSCHRNSISDAEKPSPCGISSKKRRREVLQEQVEENGDQVQHSPASGSPLSETPSRRTMSIDSASVEREPKMNIKPAIPHPRKDEELRRLMSSSLRNHQRRTGTNGVLDHTNGKRPATAPLGTPFKDWCLSREHQRQEDQQQSQRKSDFTDASDAGLTILFETLRRKSINLAAATEDIITSMHSTPVIFANPYAASASVESINRGNSKSDDTTTDENMIVVLLDLGTLELPTKKSIDGADTTASSTSSTKRVRRLRKSIFSHKKGGKEKKATSTSDCTNRKTSVMSIKVKYKDTINHRNTAMANTYTAKDTTETALSGSSEEYDAERTPCSPKVNNATPKVNNTPPKGNNATPQDDDATAKENETIVECEDKDEPTAAYVSSVSAKQNNESEAHNVCSINDTNKDKILHENEESVAPLLSEEPASSTDVIELLDDGDHGMDIVSCLNTTEGGGIKERRSNDSNIFDNEDMISAIKDEIVREDNILFGGHDYPNAPLAELWLTYPSSSSSLSLVRSSTTTSPSTCLGRSLVWDDGYMSDSFEHCLYDRCAILTKRKRQEEERKMHRRQHQLLRQRQKQHIQSQQSQISNSSLKHQSRRRLRRVLRRQFRERIWSEMKKIETHPTHEGEVIRMSTKDGTREQQPKYRSRQHEEEGDDKETSKNNVDDNAKKEHTTLTRQQNEVSSGSSATSSTASLFHKKGSNGNNQYCQFIVSSTDENYPHRHLSSEIEGSRTVLSPVKKSLLASEGEVRARSSGGIFKWEYCNCGGNADEEDSEELSDQDEDESDVHVNEKEEKNRYMKEGASSENVNALLPNEGDDSRKKKSNISIGTDKPNEDGADKEEAKKLADEGFIMVKNNKDKLPHDETISPPQRRQPPKEQNNSKVQQQETVSTASNTGNQKEEVFEFKKTDDSREGKKSIQRRRPSNTGQRRSSAATVNVASSRRFCVAKENEALGAPGGAKVATNSTNAPVEQVPDFDHLKLELASGSLTPHTLIQCQPYEYGAEARFLTNNKPDRASAPSQNIDVQPFQIKVSPDAALLVDVHVHCATSEVIGLLGGRFVADERCLYIQAAFPCRATTRRDRGSTDVEMDPVSQVVTQQVIEMHNLQVVGWYHSHPTFRPDPSVTDIVNQGNYQDLFKQKCQNEENKQHHDSGRRGMNHLDGEDNGQSEGMTEVGATPAVPPFVGLIVGTFDARNLTAESVWNWFHVAPVPVPPSKIKTTSSTRSTSSVAAGTSTYSGSSNSSTGSKNIINFPRKLDVIYRSARRFAPSLSHQSIGGKKRNSSPDTFHGPPSLNERNELSCRTKGNKCRDPIAAPTVPRGSDISMNSDKNVVVLLDTGQDVETTLAKSKTNQSSEDKSAEERHVFTSQNNGQVKNDFVRDDNKCNDGDSDNDRSHTSYLQYITIVDNDIIMDIPTEEGDDLECDEDHRESLLTDSNTLTRRKQQQHQPSSSSSCVMAQPRTEAEGGDRNIIDQRDKDSSNNAWSSGSTARNRSHHASAAKQDVAEPLPLLQNEVESICHFDELWTKQMLTKGLLPHQQTQDNAATGRAEILRGGSSSLGSASFYEQFSTLLSSAHDNVEISNESERDGLKLNATDGTSLSIETDVDPQLQIADIIFKAILREQMQHLYNSDKASSSSLLDSSSCEESASTTAIDPSSNAHQKKRTNQKRKDPFASKGNIPQLGLRRTRRRISQEHGCSNSSVVENEVEKVANDKHSSETKENGLVSSRAKSSTCSFDQLIEQFQSLGALSSPTASAKSIRRLLLLMGTTLPSYSLLTPTRKPTKHQEESCVADNRSMARAQSPALEKQVVDNDSCAVEDNVIDLDQEEDALLLSQIIQDDEDEHIENEVNHGDDNFSFDHDHAISTYLIHGLDALFKHYGSFIQRVTLMSPWIWHNGSTTTTTTSSSKKDRVYRGTKILASLLRWIRHIELPIVQLPPLVTYGQQEDPGADEDAVMEIQSDDVPRPGSQEAKAKRNINSREETNGSVSKTNLDDFADDIVHEIVDSNLVDKDNREKSKDAPLDKAALPGGAEGGATNNKGSFSSDKRRNGKQEDDNKDGHNKNVCSSSRVPPPIWNPFKEEEEEEEDNENGVSEKKNHCNVDKVDHGNFETAAPAAGPGTRVKIKARTEAKISNQDDKKDSPGHTDVALNKQEGEHVSVSPASFGPTHTTNKDGHTPLALPPDIAFAAELMRWMAATWRETLKATKTNKKKTAAAARKRKQKAKQAVNIIDVDEDLERTVNNRRI